MKKILILGKNGQVGWELRRTLATQGVVYALDRQECDLVSADSIIRVLREIKPNVIINAAAYTAVDKAEKDLDLALSINGVAPGILAEEAKKLKAIFVHYSTDYVFNGQAKHPYLENDPKAPLNVYGHSKWEGEKAVSSVGGKYFIFRTSWVYGLRGKNFLLTMLKLAKERDELQIVDDQLGAPTWSRLIAQGTAQALINDIDAWGTYHMSASGQTTWYGFAQAIFNVAKERNLKTPKLKRIATKEYALPANRPAFSVLSSAKIQKELDIVHPSWEVQLGLCMEEFS